MDKYLLWAYVYTFWIKKYKRKRINDIEYPLP